MTQVKLYLSQNNIRKVFITEDLTFIQFKALLLQSYPSYLPEEYTLTYIDDEQDHITVDCELDWTLVIAMESVVLYLEDMNSVRVVSDSAVNEDDTGIGQRVNEVLTETECCLSEKLGGIRGPKLFAGVFFAYLFGPMILRFLSSCLIAIVLGLVAVGVGMYKSPSFRKKVLQARAWVVKKIESRKRFVDEVMRRKEEVRSMFVDESSPEEYHDLKMKQYQEVLCAMGIKVSTEELKTYIAEHEGNLTAVIHHLIGLNK